jgi:hypothetical protein
MAAKKKALPSSSNLMAACKASRVLGSIFLHDKKTKIKYIGQVLYFIIKDTVYCAPAVVSLDGRYP